MNWEVPQVFHLNIRNCEHRTHSRGQNGVRLSRSSKSAYVFLRLGPGPTPEVPTRHVGASGKTDEILTEARWAMKAEGTVLQSKLFIKQYTNLFQPPIRTIYPKMLISAGMFFSNDVDSINQCANVKVGLKSNQGDAKQMAEVTAVPCSALAGHSAPRCGSLLSFSKICPPVSHTLTPIDNL